MRKKIIKLAVFLSVITVIFIVISYLIGSRLAAPVHGKIGSPPSGLKADNISFYSGETRIKGWLLRSGKNKGIIILMHGVRGNRTSMLNRARFLFKNGYSVLLFDFQAHGESDGDHITFGYLEAENARAAVNFAKNAFPFQPVAIIGQSLGGAACLIGERPIDVDALILEAVYPTIEEAIANRLEIYMGKIGKYFTPILTIQLRPRLGVHPSKLRPINGINHLTCPVLVISGGADRHTTLSETERLYKAASKPKSLWIIKGARHVDLYQFAKDEYEKRIISFLEKYLNV